MKKFGMVFAMLIFLVGLVSAQTPGRNQSLIVVRTLFGLGNDKLEVHVDGNKEAVLGNNSTYNIIVNNGNHTLTFVSLNGYAFNAPADRKDEAITANSQRIIIDVTLNAVHRISTQITGLNPNASSGNSIENATNKICESLIFDLPKNKTIAVLSVSSRDRDMATFVIEELEFQLVDSKEFRIVDRATLDKIRSEQNFQLSGDVDDNSAVSIGKMLGANIVITGTISGSGTSQRLTIKALDVQTAQIITMARESF
jgi:TolB-like protein